jgi:hypothetical protein
MESILRLCSGVRNRMAVRHGLVAVLATCLAVLLCPGEVRSQAVSRINGTVTDQTGAGVPDAKVTVTNVDTNVSQTTVTTSAGTYLIVDLIPGNYNVKVEKAGFKSFVDKNVVVTGGATSTADATLAPGTVTETVEVIAPEVALQTEQPEIGTTISETLTQELPQLISGSNRQIDNFIFLAPGVTGSGFSHRINGGLDQQTEVMFNGVPEAFSETAGFTFWNQPPYDSIKDADILTGTFSAQYGLGQGVEQYHTKSGTNVIHGDAFFFYRDDRYLAAPGAFLDINQNNRGVVDQPNTNIQSDLGFSVGGPVFLPKLYNGRNKTFWFFSYDRFRQSFVPNVVTLPTQAELSGDFSGLVNPSNGKPIPVFVPIAWASKPALIPAGCTVPATGAGSPGTPWPGNKIPTTCFSQVSAGLLKQFPIPTPTNTSAVVSNYTPATTSLNLQTDFSVNIDHNLTSKQNIHGLYWRQHFPSPNNGDWVNSPLSNENITTILGRGVDITYSNAISSHMVLTGGFLYVYQGNDFQPPHLLSSPIAPVPPSGLKQPLTFPSISFGGGGWEPVSWGPGNGLSSTINHKTGYTFLSNLLYQRGRHTMNIGVDIRKTHQDDFECGGSGGQPGCSGLLNFTSDVTADPNEQANVCGPPSPTNNCVSSPGTNTGNGFASFLLGDVTSGGRGGAGNTNLRNTYVAPYFQDDVQIKPRLKVNLGVRWDLAFPFTNDFKTNPLTFFDPNLVNAAEINPQTGQPLKGAMAELGTCSACSGWSTQNMNWHHFSPRVGFTYQLNPKTVLLGGVSWYWLDTGSFEYGVNKVAVNYGNNLNGVVSIGSPGPQIPGFGQWDTNQLPPLPAVGFSPGFFNGTSITGGAQVHELPRQVNQAYDEQFVLGVQRELPWNMFLSVSLVHTHDVHLPATLHSGQQSLKYSFVKSVCPQGPSVTTTNDCILADAWTCTAQTFDSKGNPTGPCPAPGSAQGFLQAHGFGQFTYAPGTCGGNSAPVTYFTPYNNFCQEQGTGTPLFVTQLPYPHMPFVTNNFDTSGADKYNALQVSLQKRTGSGLSFLVSYTLSRYLTNTDSGFSTFNFRGLDPANPNAEWSVGNNDQTHVLTLAGVYELPIGPGKKFLNQGGMVRKNLLGGWKLSMVDYYESGVPLPTNACADQFDCDPLIGNIFVGNRPNRVSANFGINWNNYYRKQPIINTSAFAFPGAWTIGNGAPLYNTLRAPPYLDEDLSLSKKFFFGERFSGDVTIQFYNVLNRMLLNNGPANGAGINCWHGNFTDPNFGKAYNDPKVPCQGNTPRTGQVQFRVFF